MRGGSPRPSAPRPRAAATPRGPLALAATLLVLVLAGCSGGGSDAVPGDASPSASPSASPTASPAPDPTTAAPSPTTPTAPTTPATPDGPVRALFFGDSYVIGGPYTGPDGTMAAVAADRLGWRYELRGGGGTGFISGNPEFGLGPFTEQIEQGALDVAPVDWLVVEGGSNDRLLAPADITRGAVEVLRAAAARHPEARLVLMGTFDVTVDGFTDTDPVIAALRSAAAEVGVPFIDAQRWLEGRPDLVGPDFDHPLPDGDALVGARLAQALRDLGA